MVCAGEGFKGRRNKRAMGGGTKKDVAFPPYAQTLALLHTHDTQAKEFFGRKNGAGRKRRGSK